MNRVSFLSRPDIFVNKVERFPENFRFQLTKDEYNVLRSQIVTSNGRGGRRYRPYVFTEQGIAMLSGILRSDTAIQVSIKVMNTFVEMRRFIANNALLFEKVSDLELKQLEYQKNTDERFWYFTIGRFRHGNCFNESFKTI